MTKLRDVPTWQLCEAAQAWRRNDEKACFFRAHAGPLAFLCPKPNLTLHDRISELVEEIARLRATGKE